MDIESAHHLMMIIGDKCCMGPIFRDFPTAIFQIIEIPAVAGMVTSHVI